jgi:porin
MLNKRYMRWIAVLVLIGLAEPEAAQALEGDDAPKSALRQFAEQDYLLGDWGGVRSDLSERGVDFEFLYAGAVPTVLSGGIKRGSVYQGALLMMLNVDTAKLAWENGTFRASSLWLHSGPEFSANHLGDLNKVSMLDFPDSLRLWELWYEHRFFDDRVSLKLGQLDIGMDFILPEYYTSLGMVSFLNQTFFYPTMAFNVYDQPFFPRGHHALASTPYAAPGARLRVDISPTLYTQAGVYDGNPDRSHSGTRVKLSGSEGALAYFEAGFRRNQTEDSEGLPGNIKVGGWYHTDEFVDMYEGTFAAFDNYVAQHGIPLPPVSPGEARFRGGNYGFYILADHMLWRETNRTDPANQGLIGFARAAVAPKDRNLAQLGVDGGLVYRGAIPTRDWDSLGVAVSYLEISDDLRRAQRDINALFGPFGPVLPRADYELVVELNYRAQLTAWASLQVSLQRVFHPGGRIVADIPDAWAFIVQSTLRF